ncbi:AB hydrolase-1 domain-containing protein [Fusarium sp. Ph1]|nr:AB hydrolase-1 domain-containing protein [Fusarium sp. Ph1]
MEAIAFKVSRGFTYNYFRVTPSAEPPKPYILFLHGFPSIALEWQHQIEHFRQLGFGVIAPDLLGYGGSSRPSDASHYRFKHMSYDVAEILDHEHVDVVYGVGHDMGAGLLARLSLYLPHRFSKLAFLATGYLHPGASFDLDTANSLSQKNLGYSLFGYMKFFTEDPDAVEIINSHQDSFTSLLYAKDPVEWTKHLGPIGATKQWLLEDKLAELGPWLPKTYLAARKEAFSKDGGYQAPLNWYRVLVSNFNLQDELEDECNAFDLKCPVLLVLAARDTIALPSVQLEDTQRHVKNLTVKQVSTGHWPMEEAADEINSFLQNFFTNEN